MRQHPLISPARLDRDLLGRGAPAYQRTDRQWWQTHGAAAFADYLVLTSDNPRFEEPRSIMEDIAAGITGTSPLFVEDRGEAITHALEVARRGDVVIVAGKGHETGQQLANRFVPFDDRQVVRSALASLGWNGRVAHM